MNSKVKIFQKTIQVRPEHLDENAHVNNVQYLQWVQDIAKAHWEHEAKEEWLRDYYWIALNHHISYKKPAFEGNSIRIETQIISFNGVKSTRAVKVLNNETNDLHCECTTQWVMLDKTTHKPTRCSEEMAAAFYEAIE